MTGTAADVAALLDLTVLDDDVFTVPVAPARPGDTVQMRAFGGQVAGQALRAACRTVDPGRPPHSMHAYFIRPGRPDEPVRLDVARSRDGRTFSTRHVTAAQGGKPIFELIASFHDPEPGHAWQSGTRPDVPPPDRLERSALPSFFRYPGGFDIRLVNPSEPTAFPVRHPFWIRLSEPVGDDPALHASLIAYLTDMAVVSSAIAPDSRITLGTAVSLDHTVWFHRPARVDAWLLYSVDPVINHGARGLARGHLHTLDGALVASVAQEVLLRPADA
ncbi:acyl-CoA thioesterase [Spirillospora sp. NBC_01491]|uniref:acyl-CoA thioesterase n=1 Tax=Spirillospora sp. NBC_01491 TaxID=2976007 RepID=UPI002E31AB1E|nr:acyl-CoA thioesterase domain-containing protein [Spirillospora sp. NBC_01491]